MPYLHSHGCENFEYYRVSTICQTILPLQILDDLGKDYKGELAHPRTAATVYTSGIQAGVREDILEGTYN